ncbi:hypothetical protein Tco_0992733 [Tanacetum coccineum]|uniref:Reverse transcriptase Ty1/copia-type domain-containing protein n=1 Tax=Tanacetum coccineum TaxID=301880 RepID=A0ABQ5F422_9ASTR
MAEQDTPPPTITAMKIPIIKKGEYDIWSMRMRQYICHTDHNLWDIIVNGDLQEEPAPTGDQSGPSAPPVPKTAKQLAAKRNQERVKSILLLAIPDEYLLKFHNVPDAKSLWEAIKSRFGGNEESKKMQKNIQGPPLDNEDLQQIDQDDLEELDIRWQVAMMTVRVQRFIQKTRRNLDFKGIQPVTFDKSKVECYNYHRKGHFAKECKSGRNQGKRSYGENGRRNATTNEPSSQALVFQDGLRGYDWSNDFDELVNYALMAISSSSSSSSSDNEVQNYSKQCLKSFKILQKNFNSEREKYSRARLEIQGYELALEYLESRILGHEKNELAWGKKYEFQNYKLKCRELKINNLNIELEKVVKERDELNIKIAKWEESSKSFNILLNSQMSAHDKNDDEESTSANDMFSKADGYHVVPPPITGNFLTPRADISFAGLDEYAIRKKIIESKTTELNADTSKSKTSETVGNTNEVNVEKPKFVNESVVSTTNKTKIQSSLRNWNSDDRNDCGNPEIFLQDHAVVDSGCSSHMTGNKAYLSDYEDYNGGFVAFGSDPKGEQNKSYRPSELSVRMFSLPRRTQDDIQSLEDESWALKQSFASFMGFHVYQMDVKSAFLYGTIGEEVKKQPDGIFISQDKYVANILKKFDFCSIKIATTPIESNKPLVKDKDGIDVDVHVCRSMISSLMYLTVSRPDIMFAVCARDSPFELEAFSDSDYGGASLDRKSTTGGCQFLGRRLISWTGMNLRMDGSCASSLSHIWYALSHNPTIYDSLVKQFWQTATVRTLANGIQELVASIDNKETGHIGGEHVPLLPAILAGAAPDPAAEATTTSMGVETEGATTTTSGLDAGMDSGNIHESPLRSYKAPLPEGNTLGSAEDSLILKELMDIIPKLVLIIDNLEKELQQTKSTYGKAVLTLVKRVKLVEAALKRKSKKVILSESEDEETEDQGRKIQDIDDNPLVSLVRNSMEEKEADFVTPKKVSVSGEAQEEDISPTTLEAAKTLSKVASQNVSTYKRRAMSASKGKDIGIGMDFFSAAKERLNSAKVKVNTEVNLVGARS